MAEPETKKIEDDELPELELSLKKKKKKKTTTKLDAIDDLTEETTAATTTTTTTTTAPADDGDEPLLDLDLTKKKKKKKKKDEEEPDEQPKPDDEEDLVAPKKKSKDSKKKPVVEGESSSAVASKGDGDAEESGVTAGEGAVDADEQVQDGDVEIDLGGESDEEESKDIEEFDEATWQKTDRDYHYNELLHRMYSQLRAKNPELSGGRKKYKMKVPQVLRDGSKKTVFANFQAICDSLNRNHEHLLNFVLVELGTSGSLDASNRLTIKGRYPPKHIENLIRRYVTEFVICGMCKSLDTVLERDPNTRLYILKCSNCRATRTVTAVKQGFMAQIGKRPKT